MVDYLMTYLQNKDFLIEVSKGNIAGHSLVHKFGSNGAVGNAAYETITSIAHPGLSVINSHLTTAVTMRIKNGGHVNDDAGGTGARKVMIVGLDETGAEAQEEVVTNGVANSAYTTTTFIRVFRAYVTDVGTYGGTNAGAITIRANGGIDMVIIGNAIGQTLHGMYTIPLGKTGHLLSVTLTVESLKPVSIIMFTREDILDTTLPVTGKRTKLFWNGLENNFSYNPDSPKIVLPPLTDIWFEGRAAVAGAGVSVDFEILLVDD
jgi:hypothetical protein